MSLSNSCQEDHGGKAISLSKIMNFSISTWVLRSLHELLSKGEPGEVIEQADLSNSNHGYVVERGNELLLNSRRGNVVEQRDELLSNGTRGNVVEQGDEL